MPVFVERFLLPLLVALIVVAVWNNQFKLRNDQRGTLFIAIVAVGYFIATLVHTKPETEPPATTRNDRPPIAQPSDRESGPTASASKPEAKPPTISTPPNISKPEVRVERPRVAEPPSSIAAAPRRELPPVAGCPPWPTDTPPRVTLHPDDLIVVAGGAIVRVAPDLKETTIATGGYLTDARGVAVINGRIVVTSIACQKGGVVSVDPESGTQTPVAFGFRVAMGIALERGGKTILVGDEDPKDGRWGQLVRVDLESREQTVLANLQGRNAARGIAISPDSDDVFVADTTVNRVSPSGETRQIEIDELNNASTITILRDGTFLIGEYQLGTVLHTIRGSRAPLALSKEITSNLTGLAVSNDGKWVYVSGTSGGGTGAVYKLALPFDKTTEPIEVWKGRRSAGVAVTVAVVGAP